MSRYLVVLGALSLALLTAILIGGIDTPPKTSSKALKVTQPDPLPDPPSPITASPEESDTRKVINDRELTVDTVRRIGLLQREARWIPEAMDHKHWKRVNDDLSAMDTESVSGERQIWENINQDRLIWWVQNDRVVRAEAEFQAGASSASVTALAIYLVGTNHELPVKMEDPFPGSNRVIEGNFFTPDGRRFFFRGRLRGDSEDISGPGHFAIGTEPFEGQSRLEPPVNGFFPEPSVR